MSENRGLEIVELTEAEAARVNGGSSSLASWVAGVVMVWQRSQGVLVDGIPGPATKASGAR